MTVQVKVQYNISIERKETKQMTLIKELETKTNRVSTLTDNEINQALTYYKKAGYNFNIPEIRREKLSLISDIVYVSSKNRRELLHELRYLRSKSGEYKTNLSNSTEALRDFLYHATCRFSVKLSPKPANVDLLSRKEIQEKLKNLRSNPKTSKYLVGVKLNQKTSELRKILENLTSK